MKQQGCISGRRSQMPGYHRTTGWWTWGHPDTLDCDLSAAEEKHKWLCSLTIVITCWSFQSFKKTEKEKRHKICCFSLSCIIYQTKHLKRSPSTQLNTFLTVFHVINRKNTSSVSVWSHLCGHEEFVPVFLVCCFPHRRKLDLIPQHRVAWTRNTTEREVYCMLTQQQLYWYIHLVFFFTETFRFTFFLHLH